jgi:hypothetical protein
VLEIPPPPLEELAPAPVEAEAEAAEPAMPVDRPAPGDDEQGVAG